MVRAVLRLVVMGVVTAAVLVAATALGLPTAAVLGLGVTVAGLVGMLGLARRGRGSASQHDAIEVAEAIDRPVQRAERTAPASEAAATSVAASVAGAEDPVVAAMAPGHEVDPELLMPRWRRPSLLAARKADPMRSLRSERMPMRFTKPADPGTSRRIVRYAVVQLLDRPDEVLGRQLTDLMSGDEVEVLDPSGSFWEVACPDGMVGWVHRTTLGAIGSEPAWASRRADTEPDDLLTAVLSARGIQ